MDDVQLTLLVGTIMERRLRLNQMYMEVQRIKKNSSDANLHAAIDKQLVHFLKAMTGIDKYIEKAILSANKIIALQLQLGTDIENATRLIAILKGEEK